MSAYIFVYESDFYNYYCGPLGNVENICISHARVAREARVGDIKLFFAGLIKCQNMRRRSVKIRKILCKLLVDKLNISYHS